MNGPCKRRLLAQAHGFRVESCSCGLVHVTAGPMTLRMEPGACQSFAAVLSRAAMALSAVERRDAPPRLAVLEGGTAAVEA